MYKKSNEIIKNEELKCSTFSLKYFLLIVQALSPKNNKNIASNKYLKQILKQKILPNMVYFRVGKKCYLILLVVLFKPLSKSHTKGKWRNPQTLVVWN